MHCRPVTIAFEIALRLPIWEGTTSLITSADISGEEYMGRQALLLRDGGVVRGRLFGCASSKPVRLADDSRGCGAEKDGKTSHDNPASCALVGQGNDPRNERIGHSLAESRGEDQRVMLRKRVGGGSRRAGVCEEVL